MPSIADVSRNSDIVFASLSDDAALREVAIGLIANMAKGSIFIDISTVSPKLSANIAVAFQQNQISYLRSPVSGSTAMAAAGTLTAVISGSKDTFDSMADIFAVFAKKTFYVGAGEEARAMKLVLNSMVAATSALLAEALAFGQSGGLDNATMLSVINQSAVASPLIGYKSDMIVQGNYKAAASLVMLNKDLNLLLETSSTPLPLNAHIHEIYQSGIAHGLGEEDFFVLVREAQAAGAKL